MEGRFSGTQIQRHRAGHDLRLSDGDRSPEAEFFEDLVVVAHGSFRRARPEIYTASSTRWN